MIAAVELVAEGMFELLELELELADNAAAEGALVEVVLHRLLAMGYLVGLHLSILGMRQRLVPSLHTPHWLVDSLTSYIGFLCSECQNPPWRIVETLQQKCQKESSICAVHMIIFSTDELSECLFGLVLGFDSFG